MKLVEGVPMTGSTRVAPGRLTAEEFRTLPEEEPYHLELVRGAVLRRPAPGPGRGHPAIRLAVALETYARHRDLGVVLAEMPYVLAREPDSVRVPHLSFVRRHRIPEGGQALGLWEIAPDLAVEVPSPAHTASHLEDAVVEYLEAGSRAVWVLDPEARSVVVRRADGAAERLGWDDELREDHLLPGFRVGVPELFG